MADSAASRFVLFRLGPVVWAAPASVIREVISAGPATRIPGSDRAVLGLVNLRGTLLTVVDGRRAVGLADTQEAAESIMVVELDGRVYGLLVDAVLDLVQMADLASAPAPESISPDLVAGQADQGGQRLSVLDLKALLQPVIG